MFSLCKWIIKIIITCNDNILQIISLTITDLIPGGSVDDSTLMPRYCSYRYDTNAPLTTYTSTSNIVLVVFVSNESDQKRGFIIKYAVTKA